MGIINHDKEEVLLLKVENSILRLGDTRGYGEEFKPVAKEIAKEIVAWFKENKKNVDMTTFKRILKKHGVS